MKSIQDFKATVFAAARLGQLEISLPTELALELIDFCSEPQDSSNDTVDVEIVLNDDEWFYLMKQAHRRNITLNQLINNLLEAHINDISQDSQHSELAADTNQ